MAYAYRYLRLQLVHGSYSISTEKKEKKHIQALLLTVAKVLFFYMNDNDPAELTIVLILRTAGR